MASKVFQTIVIDSSSRQDKPLALLECCDETHVLIGHLSFRQVDPSDKSFSILTSDFASCFLDDRDRLLDGRFFCNETGRQYSREACDDGQKKQTHFNSSLRGFDDRCYWFANRMS
jgi:hypothetical protein